MVILKDKDVPHKKSGRYDEEHARESSENRQRVGNGHDVRSHHGKIRQDCECGACDRESAAVVLAHEVEQSQSGLSADAACNGENGEQKRNDQDYDPQQRVREGRSRDRCGHNRGGIQIGRAGHHSGA